MSETDDPSKWERVDRFAYRFDQIGKSAVVLGAGVYLLLVSPGEDSGRFYELDKKD